MSKITKWKTEKTKVKVVFRLHFHATNIPLQGWDKLMVSFMPIDTGKVTAKTTKAAVRNGSCKWSDPIYETTRLYQDPRTKQYEEKIYRLLVSMGTSKSSFLGDCSINLADYMNSSLKPFSVSFPLQGCQFGTVLHVAVQLLTSKTGFREFKQQKELQEKGLEMILDEKGANHELPFLPENDHNESGKGSSRLRTMSQRLELLSLEEEGEVQLNVDCADSAVDSSYTSESLCTEKLDVSSVHEYDSLKSTLSCDVGILLSNQAAKTELEETDQLVDRGTGEWVHNWCKDLCVDSGLTATYERIHMSRFTPEATQSSLSGPNLEMDSPNHQLRDISAETGRLSELTISELAPEEHLLKEVSLLKSELSQFRAESILPKGQSLMNGSYELFDGSISKFCGYMDKVPFDVSSQLNNSIEEQKSGGAIELNSLMLWNNWFKSLCLLESKFTKMKQKSCSVQEMQELGSLQMDLEIVESFLVRLKCHTIESISRSRSMGSQVNLEPLHHDVSGSDIQRVEHSEENQHHGFCEAEQEYHKVSNESDTSRVECENLRRKMEEMESYYESLIHELEEAQRVMRLELESIKDQHSSCLYIIPTLESKNEKIQREMDEQCARFAEEKHAADIKNLYLEKKAVAFEAAQRKLRWDYALLVDRLEKDLETLSLQVVSMYETTESMARQALSSQILLQEYENEESEESHIQHSDELLNLSFKKSCISKLQVVQANTLNLDGCTELNDLLQETGCSNMGNNVARNDRGASFPLGHIGADSGSATRGIYAQFGELQKKDICTFNRIKLEKVNFADKSNQYPGPLGKKIGASDAVVSLIPREDYEHISSIPKVQVVSHQSDNIECEEGHEVAKEELCKSENPKELEHSLLLQEKLQQKTEKAQLQAEVHNIYLEVLSIVMKESLCRACLHVVFMNERQEELSQQLDHHIESKASLLLQMQDATNDIKLNETAAKEKELVELVEKNQLEKAHLENEVLSLKEGLREMKLHLSTQCEQHEKEVLELSQENSFLLEKLRNYEIMVAEFSIDKHNSTILVSQKEELVELVEECQLEKAKLETEVMSLKECLNKMKLEFDHQSMHNEDLEEKAAFLDARLKELRFKMLSSGEEVLKTCRLEEVDGEDIGNAITHLFEIQDSAHARLQRLIQVNHCTEEQRDTAIASLINLELQISLMKEAHEADMKRMSIKLDMSTQQSEKLLAELAEITSKFMTLSEAEAKHRAELSASKLEVQSLTVTNENLWQRLMCSETSNEELQTNKLQLSSEIKFLQVSLDSALQESFQEELNLLCMKESLRHFLNGLHDLRSLRFNLEISHSEQLKMKESGFNHSIAEKEVHKTSIELVHRQLEKLAEELVFSQERLKCLQDELQNARKSKDELEDIVSLLKLGLTEKHKQLLSSTKQEEELLNKAAAFELENSKLRNSLLRSEECLKKSGENMEGSMASLIHLEMQVEMMKQKLETDLKSLLRKINDDNGHSEKIYAEAICISNNCQKALEGHQEKSEENKTLTVKLSALESEVQDLTDRNEALERKVIYLEDLTENLQENKSELILEKNALNTYLHSVTEESFQEQLELLCLKESLRHVLSHLQFMVSSKVEFESKLSKELERKQQYLKSFISENEALSTSLNSANEHRIKQAEELACLTEKLICLQDELHSLSESRSGLAHDRSDLSATREQLVYPSEKNNELIHINQKECDLLFENAKLKDLSVDFEQCLKKAQVDLTSANNKISDFENDMAAMHIFMLIPEIEGTFLKHEYPIMAQKQKTQIRDIVQKASDLQVENSRINTLLAHFKECQKWATAELQLACDAATNLEYDNDVLLELLLIADIEGILLKNHFRVENRKIDHRIRIAETNQMDLHSKLDDAYCALSDQMDRLALCVEHNANLQSELTKLRSELACVLSEKENQEVLCVELRQEITNLNSEIGDWRKLILNFEEEIDFLQASRGELDIMILVQLYKLEEQNLSLNRNCLDLNKLQSLHDELQLQLSEQVLKTEEFRTLAIQVKEESKLSQSQEKEHERQSNSVQESLRVAFIRDQYETDLQDLKTELFACKRNGENLLLKFQSALDELEARKRSEAIQIKKNEDLSMRVVGLEAELQNVLNDMQGKSKDHNYMKDRLEHAFRSVDVIEEEKQKLVITLQECDKEKVELLAEVDRLKNKRTTQVTRQSQQRTDIDATGFSKETDGPFTSAFMSSESPLKFQEAAFLTLCTEDDDVNSRTNGDSAIQIVNHQLQSAVEFANLQNSMIMEEKDIPLDNNMDHLMLVSKLLKEKTLGTSLQVLQQELEKLKKDNLAPHLDDELVKSEQRFEDLLQTEMAQLIVVNEQISHIYPQFSAFIGSGNALERVLALEMELADAMQSKKRSSMFQSSFLRQLNDEEAVFQSFRDINELIKDMLELKKKNLNVETELREMHDRYSQLSLKFAEVEGERQKLAMTIKNIKSQRLSLQR